MIKKNDFRALVDLAMKTKNHSHMRPVIEKELLHYDILFALDKENILKNLTFQGGTALRLCYGASRFSEDLDFTGGTDFSTDQLIDMKTCIEDYIGKRYGLEVSVKEPSEMEAELRNENIKVNKWQIRITTAPEKKDIPKQNIKIEVVNIPSYSREPKTLKANYDFLPDGYSDTIIMVESLDEIMADKLISLVNCEKYVRYRDFWDLRWLQQHGATINPVYILSKIKDYKISDYEQRLNHMMNEASNHIHGKLFYNQMSRFTPMDVQTRTLQQKDFLNHLTIEIMMLLNSVKTIIQPSK